MAKLFDDRRVRLILAAAVVSLVFRFIVVRMPQFLTPLGFSGGTP